MMFETSLCSLRNSLSDSAQPDRTVFTLSVSIDATVMALVT